MTHNTREGIEKLLPCIDPQCDNHGTTITVNSDGEPEQMQCEYCYRERFPILDFIHQELQKARDELAAEIIKDVNTMWVDELSRKEREDGATAIGYSRVVAYLSNKNQSELDQPNK